MLPTTIVSNGKTLVLHPKVYSDLNRSEATFLARLAMITRNGTQPCWYTDKQVMDEFHISRPTASRIFAKLTKLGYITSTKVTNTYGNNIRQVEVNPDKLNRTIFAEAKSQTEEQNTPAPAQESPATSATPIALPAQTAPKELNPDIAAALASPLAGSQPTVCPSDWSIHLSQIWEQCWVFCDDNNAGRFVPLCVELSRHLHFSYAHHCSLCITPEHPEGAAHTPAYRQLVADVDAATERGDFLTVLAAKLKNYNFCKDADYQKAAVRCFAYCFTVKFLREHQDCPPELTCTMRDLLRQEARAYTESLWALSQDGQTDMTQKLLTDFETPEQFRDDPRWPEFVTKYLVPKVSTKYFANTLEDELQALDEPVPLSLLTAHRVPLRRKRELITYAPAEGVDPRGLPCYQPFTNTTVFDLGPALDQTKFGRFTCFDVNGAQHDFKFDFTALDELLSWRYVDKVTTSDLPTYDPHYITCFKGDPCLAKAIHDYILFAIVTELIAPITPEQVFYNMQEHQDGDLLALFQDHRTHRSLLMTICDSIYPTLTEDPNDYPSRPLFNAIQRSYCAGSKTVIEYAANKVAWEVVRLLGDPKTSAKVFAAVAAEFKTLGRSTWLMNLKVTNCPTKRRGYYNTSLPRILVPDDTMAFIPRLTYPYLLIRKLFAIRSLTPDVQYNIGRSLCMFLDFDYFAARDLSVVKAIYTADYPFLAQMEVRHD